MAKDDKSNAAKLKETKSANGKLLRQNQTGALYVDAIDVEGSALTYTETNIDAPISPGPPVRCKFPDCTLRSSLSNPSSSPT